MQQRALVLALMTMGMLPTGYARAADDCSQMFVYSVNQFCRTLSNGFSQCQPVGMVGPAPNCAKPGVPPIMPVPLAPPVTHAPAPYNYLVPFPPPAAAPLLAQPAAPGAPAVSAPASAAKPEAPAVAATQPKVAAPAAAPGVAVTAAPSPEVSAAPIAPPAAPRTLAMPKVITAPAPVEAPPAPVAAAPKATPAPAPAPAAVEAKPAPAPVAVESKPAPVPPVAVSATTPVAPAAPLAKPAEPVPAAVAATPAPASAEAEHIKPSRLVLQDGVAHFEFDRAELSEKARAELDAWLTQPIPKGKPLRVTGHADRLGPAYYNLKLSGRRAETVKKYLVGKGLEGRDIQVVAKGEGDPVKRCHGAVSPAVIACLAPNRRVEIDPE